MTLNMFIYIYFILRNICYTQALLTVRFSENYI